jgi:hypothetical protein
MGKSVDCSQLSVSIGYVGQNSQGLHTMCRHMSIVNSSSTFRRCLPSTCARRKIAEEVLPSCARCMRASGGVPLDWHKTRRGKAAKAREARSARRAAVQRLYCRLAVRLWLNNSGDRLLQIGRRFQ